MYYDEYDEIEEYMRRENDFYAMQAEEAKEIEWKILNSISDEDLEEGPMLYDAITGAPIYRHGGCYNPHTGQIM